MTLSISLAIALEAVFASGDIVSLSAEVSCAEHISKKESAERSGLHLTARLKKKVNL